MIFYYYSSGYIDVILVCVNMDLFTAAIDHMALVILSCGFLLPPIISCGSRNRAKGVGCSLLTFAVPCTLCVPAQNCEH